MWQRIHLFSEEIGKKIMKHFILNLKTITVVDLPPHPLKDQVAVGDYELEEYASTNNLKTGQSFNYEFKIVGEGNISGIDAPTPLESDVFDFILPTSSRVSVGLAVE